VKECIKVGLLGAGTVGSGVLTVLEENTAEIEKKVGVPIHVSKILVRDMKKAKELSEKYQLTDKIEDIVEDPEIDIVLPFIKCPYGFYMCFIISLFRGKSHMF
jgi:homoserine dehydrogenase